MNSLFAQTLVDHFHHSNQLYFLITDSKGCIISANPHFIKDTGYIAQPETPLLSQITAVDETGKCNAAIKRSLQHPGTAVSTDLLFRHSSGDYIRIHFELSSWMEKKGSLPSIYWIGIQKNDANVGQKTTSDRLHRSELFYRNLIADSLDGILLTSETGVISFASASIQKILGYEPRDLLGRNAFEFLHPADRAEDIDAFFREIERTKQSRFITVRLMQRSGEWLWCMIRGHNMFSNPHVGAMLIYVCDDTLRKKAEEALIESEQRFRHLIHNLNLGVILVNTNGEILIYNQATATMFDLTGEQLQGRNIFRTDLSIIHEDGSIFSVDDFPVKVAIKTKRSVTDVVMGIGRSKDEERLWLLVSAEPVLDNNNDILYIISSFTNITVQKLLSIQLIEQQKQLMQATIDAQEKERSEIGRELHDNISQHITTTRLYLEVAREKASGDVLSMINHAHKGLLDTVNEMRQLSQSLVPPSLSDIGLVASIEDLCSPLTNTHAFSISFHRHLFDETILPDNMKLMIFRIIQEQINNIIRHSQATKIAINLQTHSHRVMISVADNGRGFDPASVKKGLGFANINSRASLFGGALKINAAPGKGCTIQVDIPFVHPV